MKLNKAQGVFEAKSAVGKLAEWGLVNISNPENPHLTFRGKQALADMLNESMCAEWVSTKMRSFVLKYGMSHDEAAIATMGIALILEKYSDWGMVS